MATETSTGFESRLNAGESFAQLFNGGALMIYSGEQPATADDPATGTLLAIVTDRGLDWTPGAQDSGLRFISTGRFVLNDPAQSWVIRGVATGTPGWCRLVGGAVEDAEYSLTAPRIDGRVGTVDDDGDVQLRLIARLMNMDASVSADLLRWYFARPPIGD